MPREMFDRANATAIKRDNVTKAAEGVMRVAKPLGGPAGLGA